MDNKQLIVSVRNDDDACERDSFNTRMKRGKEDAVIFFPSKTMEKRKKKSLNKLRNELFPNDESQIRRVKLEKKRAFTEANLNILTSNVESFLGLQIEWKAARGQRNFTIVSLAIAWRPWLEEDAINRDFF